MSQKLPYLEKKTPQHYSITLKVAMAFDTRCSELKISRSGIVEEKILEFLNDTKEV